MALNRWVGDYTLTWMAPGLPRSAAPLSGKPLFQSHTPRYVQMHCLAHYTPNVANGRERLGS